MTPKAKHPLSDDFGKPHTLLTNPPSKLTVYLIYQQTFPFETSKEEGQKKIAFHALPFDKTMQTWIVTDITGSYVENVDYTRMSALECIRTVLGQDQTFHNVVDRCYVEIASALDLDGRVKDALKLFHLTTTILQQADKDDHVVWQLMAKPISHNHNHHNEWVQSI